MKRFILIKNKCHWLDLTILFRLLRLFRLILVEHLMYLPRNLKWNTLVLRFQINVSADNTFYSKGFLEITTPRLTCTFIVYMLYFVNYLFYYHLNNLNVWVYMLSLGLNYLNSFLSRNRKVAFTPFDLQYLGITNELYARSSMLKA